MPSQRFVTIHGHFYQPPRENPWLDAVETQDSAFPYHDWNERITTECYEPNATARIMDDADHIRAIVNNYASISFNFGPTLLSWLQSAARETYAAIVDADRQSRETFSGHGNALAQAYNHVILPLANARDQRTQVRWGIRDFEHRFGRKPEGMWLPETAVDVATLEALAAEGIAFTILEPHQALWNGKPVDPTQPYLCRLPSGRSIAIVFYDGPISRAVAFEQLLARGENLAHRLAGAFSDARPHPQLVSIATDGETYGHHHRFGEMALAYALQYLEDHELGRLTNYAEYLALNPPVHEVTIVDRTSWSCAHGVERWRSDCGCETGASPGWNQQWRAPLRAALDWLRDECAIVFEQQGARLLRDPWAARDEYIEVILDRSEASVAKFMATHALPGASVATILELVEMQRNAMLMYTSCGWFFSDLSGIETVQVLHYAARVIQLAERVSATPLEPQFLELLGPARSNLPDRGTARQIYEREVIPARLDLGRVAAHYAVLALFDSFDDDTRVYCYEVSRRQFEIHKAGRARLAIGAIEVRSTITHETAAFELAVLHLGETEITGGVRAAPSSAFGTFSPASGGEGTHRETLLPSARGEGARRADEGSSLADVRAQLAEAMEPGEVPHVIRLLDQHFRDIPVSIRSLFRDEQRRILRELLNNTLAEAESTFRQLHERYDPLMRFHTRLGIPVPQVLRTAAEFDLNLQLRRNLEEDPVPLAEIESRLREARDESVTLDETTLMAFRQAIERASELFRERPDDADRLESLESLVSIVRDAHLPVDLRAAQNRYYRMRKAMRAAIEASAARHEASRHWIELFDSLGEKLSITSPAAAPVRV